MIPLDKESRVHALGAEYKLKSSTGKPSNLFDKSVIHAVVSVRERNGGDCERGKFTATRFIRFLRNNVSREIKKTICPAGIKIIP